MKGKIYKIIHDQSNICYVGSTFDELRNRFRQHKNSNGKHSTSLTPFITLYGIEHFKIILIKEYEVIDRDHLKVYEQLWINKLQCINQSNPFNCCLKQRSSEYSKKYYAANRDKISDHKKQYRASIQTKLKTKHQCECSGQYTYANRAAHFRSKKHVKHLAQ